MKLRAVSLFKWHITIIYVKQLITINKINMLNEKIIKICEQKFIYFNYSPRTKENYMYHIIRFIKEIPPKELEQVNKAKKDKVISNRMNIQAVKTLQEAHPELIIGGSVALFLYGVRLNRFETSTVDFDITLPYWKNLSVGNIIQHNDLEDRPSGSDYMETCSINGIKADIRIEPKQKYNFVEYDNFKFKVIPLWTIIEAKAKYAHSVKGGEKHRKDLNEMILGINSNNNVNVF